MIASLLPNSNYDVPYDPDATPVLPCACLTSVSLGGLGPLLRKACPYKATGFSEIASV